MTKIYVTVRSLSILILLIRIIGGECDEKFIFDAHMQGFIEAQTAQANKSSCPGITTHIKKHKAFVMIALCLFFVLMSIFDQA